MISILFHAEVSSFFKEKIAKKNHSNILYSVVAVTYPEKPLLTGRQALYLAKKQGRNKVILSNISK